MGLSEARIDAGGLGHVGEGADRISLLGGLDPAGKRLLGLAQLRRCPPCQRQEGGEEDDGS